jgi:hypothetical protein
VSPLGRTVGLVAPTAAEYRSLGPNEALLAAIRAATGGTIADDPVAVWRHDLAATSTFTDLWPALLVLAMLLWPIDVALRRVSVGRRELASARAWVRGLPARRHRAAPRTADVEVLIAARERASVSAARTAMRAATDGERKDAAAPATEAPATEAPNSAGPTTAPAPPPSATPIRRAAAPPPAASPAPTAGEAGAPGGPPVGPTSAEDTMARLREAKRRTRER